jgi:hypothetical protein
MAIKPAQRSRFALGSVDASVFVIGFEVCGDYRFGHELARARVEKYQNFGFLLGFFEKCFPIISFPAVLSQRSAS